VLSRPLADLVVVVHVAYVVFLPVGGFLAWRWPRVLPVHLAALIVAIASVTVGFDCPLTTWENSLRRHGAEMPYTDGFLNHYLAGRLYPHGHDTLVQLVVAAAVLTSYIGFFLRQRAHTPTQLTASSPG
jgi:hypothetical protein